MSEYFKTTGWTNSSQTIHIYSVTLINSKINEKTFTIRVINWSQKKNKFWRWVEKKVGSLKNETKQKLSLINLYIFFEALSIRSHVYISSSIGWSHSLIMAFVRRDKKSRKRKYFIIQRFFPTSFDVSPEKGDLLGHLNERNLVSISSTFYEQLLHAQIPKAQKRLWSQADFLRFWDLQA